MEKIVIWHNQNCSKSREAMSILEMKGCDKEIINYLDSKPTMKDINSILDLLSMNPRELMRTKESIYKELNLESQDDNNELIEAMVRNPILIERPIIVKGSKAIIGRPTSKIAEFLNS